MDNRILRIGLPCLGEQALLILTTTLSAILLGNLGNDELIISNMTANILNWIQAIFTGMAVGISVVVSRISGNDKNEKIPKTIASGIIVICGISIFTLIISWVFSGPLTVFFYGKHYAEKALSYFIMSIAAMPSVAYVNAVSAASRGMGDSVLGLVATLFLNIINITVTFLFCYKDIFFFGLDKLTLAGIATLTSKCLSAVFAYILFRTRHRKQIPTVKDYFHNTDCLKKICRVGIPTAVEYFIFRAGVLGQQQILSSLGAAVQGGYQIGMRVLDFTVIFGTAFQTAGIVVISGDLGENDIKRAEKTKRTLCKYSVVIFSALTVILFLFASPLAYLFTKDRADILTSGISFAKYIGILSIAYGMFMTFAGILRGAGDNKFVTVITVAATWTGRIAISSALLYFSVPPMYAVIIGLGGDFIIRAIFFGIRLQKNKWQYIKI